MPTLIPYPARRVRRLAETLLILSAASRERFSTPLVWRNRPEPREPLGNTFQRIALRSPDVVLLFENLADEVLELLEQQAPIG